MLTAIAAHPDLVAVVKDLQLYAMEVLVNASEAKAAMKLYNKFALTEDQCPQLKPLCERGALAWHVSSGHLDMLEGLVTRR